MRIESVSILFSLLKKLEMSFAKRPFPKDYVIHSDQKRGNSNEKGYE